MSSPPAGYERPEFQRKLERELSLHERREKGAGGFWRSVAVLGTVGWPIALASLGGVLIGRRLDLRLHTGIQCTLLFLTVGAILGSIGAWRLVNSFGDEGR